MAKKKLETNATKKKSSSADFHEELMTRRENIALLKGERERIAALPPPPSVPVEIVGRKIDEAVIEFQHRGLNLEESGSLLYAVTDGAASIPHVKPETIVAFGCLLLGHDVVKAKCVEAIQRSWPRETISETNRAQKLADLDRQIFEAEVAEEVIINDFEKLGARIPRRGDLDVRVFLETEEAEKGFSFNREKLNLINRMVNESHGVNLEIHRRRENLTQEKNALLEQASGLGPSEPLSRVKAEIERVDSNLKELNREYQEYAAGQQSSNQLRTACKEFLAAHGLDENGKSLVQKKIFEPDEIHQAKMGAK